MKFLLASILMSCIFFIGCKNPKADIVNEQVNLKKKIEWIDHLQDSLEAAKSPDQSITESVAIQLYSRKLQKEKEEYLRDYDSLELELKKY